MIGAGRRLPEDTLEGNLIWSISISPRNSFSSGCLPLGQEKIRLYEKIDRAPLRKFDKSWFEAVAKYAKAEGSGAPIAPACIRWEIRWLPEWLLSRSPQLISFDELPG